MKRHLNILRKALGVATLLLGFLASVGPARAADYAVQKTFWSFAGTWTNNPATATNLASAIDLTQFGDFALQIVAKGTNAAGAAGNFDIVWETSLDGSNWPAITNAGGGSLLRTVGWFSAPVQSNAVTTTWLTNITVDSIGYWRIRHLTNAANMNYTNIAITGYVKPKRSNADF